MVWVPSPEIVTSALVGALGAPSSEKKVPVMPPPPGTSVGDSPTVTVPVFQPAAVGPGVKTAAVTAVVCVAGRTLMVSVWRAPRLPAASSAAKEIVVAPGVVMFTAAIAPATVCVPSVVCAPVSINAMSCTPLPPVSGAERLIKRAPTKAVGPVSGGTVAIATGGVLSTFTVALVVVLKLMLFMAVQVSTMPGVSWVTAVAPQPVVEAIPEAESGSVTDQRTVTSVLFHPLGFGAGRITGVTTGGAPA